MSDTVMNVLKGVFFKLEIMEGNIYLCCQSNRSIQHESRTTCPPRQVTHGCVRADPRHRPHQEVHVWAAFKIKHSFKETQKEKDSFREPVLGKKYGVTLVVC